MLYNSVHRKLARVYGRASEHPCTAEFWGMTCEGLSTHMEWAFTGTGHDEGRTAYSDDLDEYTPLCRRCHEKFDDYPRQRAGGKTGAAGKIGGKKNVESGHMAALVEMNKKSGHYTRLGNISKESGHLAKIQKKGNTNRWKRELESVS